MRKLFLLILTAIATTATAHQPLVQYPQLQYLDTLQSSMVFQLEASQYQRYSTLGGSHCWAENESRRRTDLCSSQIENLGNEASKSQESEYQISKLIYESPVQYKVIDRLHLSLAAAWVFNLYENTIHMNHLDCEDFSDFAPLAFTLSCWQTEVSFDVVCKQRYAIALGVGYDHTRYHCKDPYVNIAQGSHNLYVTTTPTFGDGDLLQYWHSDLTTHYLNIPVSFTYYSRPSHHQGLRFGVEVVAGVPLGKALLHQRFSNYHDMMNAKAIDPNVANTYSRWECMPQCDLRLSIGWSRVSIMAQMSPVELMHSPASSVCLHPVRIGVKLNL